MAQGVRVSREEIVGENQHPQVGELLEHRVWYLGDLVESGRTTTTTTTRTLCHSQKQKARRWMVRAPQVDMVQKWLGRPAAVARKGLEQLCSGERTTSIRTEAIQEIRREEEESARAIRVFGKVAVVEDDLPRLQWERRDDLCGVVL